MSTVRNLAYAYAEWFSQMARNSADRMEKALTEIDNDTYTIDLFFKDCMKGWKDVYDVSPFVGLSGIRLFSSMEITDWGGSGGYSIPSIAVEDAANVSFTPLATVTGKALTAPAAGIACHVSLQADASNKSVQLHVDSLTGTPNAGDVNGQYAGFLYEINSARILANLSVHVQIP